MNTVERLQKIGFAIVNDVLTAKEVEHYKELLMKLREEELQINPKFCNKPPQQFVNNIAARTRAFDPLIEHPIIMETGAAVLGENFTLSEVRACSVEKCEDSPFVHRDDYIPTYPDYPIALIAVWMINDYSKSNGATVIFPGSHFWPFKPNKELAENYASIQAEASAGSLFMFNANLWHGPAGNPTGNPRWGLFHVYSPWYMKPYFDNTSRISKSDFDQLSDRMKILLGFTTKPPSDETERTMTTIKVEDIPKYFDFK